jgi:hypothetical protein
MRSGVWSMKQELIDPCEYWQRVIFEQQLNELRMPLLRPLVDMKYGRVSWELCLFLNLSLTAPIKLATRSKLDATYHIVESHFSLESAYGDSETN